MNRRTMNACIVAAGLVLAAMAMVSCNDADELPPLQESYATTVILPDPVDLTAAEREYIKELKEEYDSSLEQTADE